MTLFVVTRLEVVVGSCRRARLAPVTFPCTPCWRFRISNLVHESTYRLVESTLMEMRK